MSFLDTLSNKYVHFAPVLLRLAVAAVLLSLGASIVVGGDGLFSTLELIIVVLLAIGIVAGFHTRELAWLAAFVFLLLFLAVLGKRGWVVDPNLFRDFGLIGISLALSLIAPGPLSVDQGSARKRQKGVFLLSFVAQPAAQKGWAVLACYAPLCIRIGLSVVFFLFGFQKLLAPGQTTAEIQQLLFDPNSAESLGLASVINYYTGLFEMIIGIGLLVGFRVRVLAFVAAVMAGGIFGSFIVKYGVKNDFTLYRDMGLVFGSLALTLIGGGALSLDGIFAKKRGESALCLALVPEEELKRKRARAQQGDEKSEVTVGEKGEYKLPPSKLNLS